VKKKTSVSPGEDNLKIVVRCDGIELANEEYVLWRRNVRVRQVAHHFQDCGPRPRFLTTKKRALKVVTNEN
jgi:hypothetical protein